MTYRVESVRDPTPVLDRLIPELEAYTYETYGVIEGQISHADDEYFVHPRGRLWALYDDEKLIGMTGWTDLAQLSGPNPFKVPTVEIKRVFLQRAYRGKGLTLLLDDYLLPDIFANGYLLAVGETGYPQVGSVKKHSKAPYFKVQPFGEYAENEDSYFFGCNRSSWLAYLGKRYGEAS